MNDELSGQLAGPGWQIPDYAQRAIWLETESGVVRTEGPRGLFTLAAPAEWLTVRFGHAAGPALTRLRWHPDNLEWDGKARVAGVIEALHLTGRTVPGVTIGVLHLIGQPLSIAALPYPSPDERTGDVYHLPEVVPLAGLIDETLTTWLVGEDSPLMGLVHDAFSNGVRVWFTGELAEEDSGWERFFALPLLLETVTLFAT